MKEPIFKDELFYKAFGLVAKIAAGEQNLQDAASELINMRDFAFTGGKTHDGIKEFTNSFGCELPDNCKVVAATNENGDVYVQFTNCNLITDMVISKEGFESMVSSVLNSIAAKG